MYLTMADEGYFGGSIYLKITLDVIFCMKTEDVQALHDSIKNFGRSGVAGEPVKTITTTVKLLIIFCAKLSEINNLTSKAKLYMLEGFFNCSVDKFRFSFTLILNQKRLEDIGNSIDLSNNIQKILKK